MNKKRIIKPLFLLSVLCLFLTTSCENLLTDTSAEDVAAAKTALSIQFADKDSESSVTKNIVLPVSADKEVVISWTSDNTAVSSTGKVRRPSAGSDDVTVVLTATLTKKKASDTKKFTLTVKAFPDTTAPQEVTDLTAEAGNAQAVLSWKNPSDSDFEGVKITANGIEEKTITKDKTSETITGLTNGTEYTFTVKTYDTAGNISKGTTVKVKPIAPEVPASTDPSTTPRIKKLSTYTPAGLFSYQVYTYSDSQIRIDSYDSSDNLTGYSITTGTSTSQTQIQYDVNDAITGSTVSTFNSSGNTTEYVLKDSDGNTFLTLNYEYDSHNNTLKMTTTQGSVISITDYSNEYDTAAKLTKVTVTNSGAYLTRSTYTYSENVTTINNEQYSSGTWVSSGKSITTYNSSGYIMEQEFLNTSDEMTSRTEYEYE